MDKNFIKNNEHALRYLFDLQASGRTNMFVATAYLQREVGLNGELAREVLMFWMNNYEAVAKELGIDV